MPASMFERYGGFAKVSRIVSSFYDKVLDSPVLNPYFAHADMKRLIDHQTKFIAQVMGGPVSYSNDVLERAHADLHIDSKAFEAMVSLLVETFEDFEIEPQDVALIEQEIRSRERFIVQRR